MLQPAEAGSLGPHSALTDSQRDRRQLSLVKRKEEQLRQWLATRSDYSEEEKSAIKCNDSGDVARYWLGVAESGKDDLEQCRRRGWRKWAARYQTFGSGVIGFMKDWEPLISVVKALGGGYGDLSIGTISLVFVVAKNKQDSEGSIATAFTSIKDRILGFKMYQDIYRESSALESDLRAKIVDAYSVFIELAIEATKYYKDGGTWRWLRTFGDPGKFKRMASEVEDSIVAIRLRCDDLLSQNVHALKVQVKQLEKKLDDEAWNEFCRVWKLAHFTSDQDRIDGLARYRRDLRENLSPYTEQFSAHDDQRLAFEASDEYKKWTSPNESNILVLVGYSERSIAVFQPYCWLSPWALDIIERCKNERRHHAYYILPPKDEVALDSVVVTMLLQLLRLKIPAFRDDERRRDLMVAYGEAADTQQSAGCRTGALTALALSVLGLFDASERVEVFVDRLDKCFPAQRMALLDILGCMVRSARCTLKVLIIVSGSDWAFQEQALGKDDVEHVVVYRAEQRIMASAED